MNVKGDNKPEDYSRVPGNHDQRKDPANISVIATMWTNGVANESYFLDSVIISFQYQVQRLSDFSRSRLYIGKCGVRLLPTSATLRLPSATIFIPGP